jgi:hypothetical protein
MENVQINRQLIQGKNQISAAGNFSTKSLQT